MYLIEFDAIALAIILVAMYFYYTRKRIKDGRGRKFEVLLITVALDTIAGIASSLLLNALPRMSHLAALSVNTLFYLTHSTVPLLFAAYIVDLCAWWPRSRKLAALFYLPWALSLALVALNAASPFIFDISSDGLYLHLPAFPIIYASPLFYIALIIVSILKPRSDLSRHQRVSFIAAILLPIGAIGTQNLIPGLMLESFSCALGALFAFLTIQNTDELIDGQTGLFNRGAFISSVRDRFSRKGTFHVIAIHSRELITLQDFLDINEYERMLRSFSSWLALTAGESLTPCNIGDGLFALVSRNGYPDSLAGETAVTIASKAGDAWKLPVERGEVPIRVMTLAFPRDGSGISEAMDWIDQLTELTLGTANRHIFYTADFVKDKKRLDATIAERIVEAIHSKSLTLYIQPIHSVEKGAACAAEALLSVETPSTGLVRQHDVMRIAERVGMASELSDAFFERVAQWYVESRASERGIERVEARLLAGKSLEPDWASPIIAALERAGLEPHRLCVEITETTLANRTDTFRQNMARLSALGVAFALDDFGSGYTDLRTIIEFPFDVVKIDKKLVHLGLTTEKGRRLLSGINALFTGLERPLVAEGIESDDQLSSVKALGFRYLQGYRLGRPARADGYFSETRQ